MKFGEVLPCAINFPKWVCKSDLELGWKSYERSNLKSFSAFYEEGLRLRRAIADIQSINLLPYLEVVFIFVWAFYEDITLEIWSFEEEVIEV
jgi:hypothetical protein